MSLVAIASPQSESELSVMLCTLEAHGIPTFVQGSGFGSLYPGPQIAFYNARRIMVPSEYALEAKKALIIFAEPVEQHAPHQPTILHTLRIILEFLVFGWYIPSNRQPKVALSNSSSKRTRGKSPRAA
jgi:hypothetical protein